METRNKPVRIQRKRNKGWRMPENTVYVGRPSKWGNRWFGLNDNERARAVELFEDWIMLDTNKGRREDIVKYLKGKNLCCWCRIDKPCHADILLKIANDELE